MDTPENIGYVESLIKSAIHHFDAGREKEGITLIETAAKLGKKHLTPSARIHIIQRIVQFEIEPSVN